MSISYLSPGLFDMGGIARYGRYQVRALRSIVGKRGMRVVSMLGPEAGGFDEPFPVDSVAGGTTLGAKLRFAWSAAAHLRAGGTYWSGHLNYAPLVLGAAQASGGIPVCNIYGLEVWSNRSALKARALRRCHVVVDCHATREIAVELGMTTAERSHVIWDPVDLEVYHPDAADPALGKKYGMAPGCSFRVMFLGRLARAAAHKSPDSLIRAFARASLPADAELVIAGSGERREELRALAQSTGKADRILFTGRVPDEELAPMYRLASAFALISRRYDGGGEGIPLTPLEAAACGVPILVGNEDGSREACIDGESGLILGSRDEDALVAALERLAAEPTLRERMGRAAADRMRTHFSYDRFVREHEALLRELSAVGRDRSPVRHSA